MTALFRSFAFSSPPTATIEVGDYSPEIGTADRASPRPIEDRAENLGVEEQQAMARRRAEVLRTMFPKLFSWLARRWDIDAVAEANSYLEQSSNLADLEERIRRLQQRRHFGV
jgi:hypothetical protein